MQEVDRGIPCIRQRQPEGDVDLAEARQPLAHRGSAACQQPHTLGGARHLTDDHELVTADAPHERTVASRTSQAVRHGHEDRIAHAVAQRVVEDLETVEVPEHGANRAISTPVEELGHPFLHGGAVEQTGQLVGLGTLEQELFGVRSL